MLIGAAKAVKLSAGRALCEASTHRLGPANKTFDTADKIVKKNQTMERRWQQQQQQQAPLSAPPPDGLEAINTSLLVGATNKNRRHQPRRVTATSSQPTAKSAA